jgi:hypothetical protein
LNPGDGPSAGHLAQLGFHDVFAHIPPSHLPLIPVKSQSTTIVFEWFELSQNHAFFGEIVLSSI